MLTPRRFALFPDMRARLDAPERLGDPDCDPLEFERTLRDFRITNRWLSRSRFLLARHVFGSMRKEPGRPRHLVDIGAGGGDLAAWLVGEARRRGLRLRVTAVDADPRAVALARRWHGALPGLDVRQGDVRDLDGLKPVDYVFGNHILHHLEDGRIGDLLAYLSTLGTTGILLNDLERGAPAYAGFLVLGSLRFGRRSITVEDGLVSIRRGFRAGELAALAARARAPAPAYRVLRLFPARLALIRGFG